MKNEELAAPALKDRRFDTRTAPDARRWAARAMMLTAMLAMAFSLRAQTGRQDADAQGLQAAPSVEEIITRNAAARGGLQAWRAVTGLSEAGRMEAVVELSAIGGARQRKAAAHPKIGVASNGMTVPFKLHLKRPHKLYLELQYNGVTAVEVFDGRQGWTVTPSPDGAVLRKFRPEAARAASMQQDLDGPLIDSAAKNTKVALEDTELIGGRKNYRLKLTLSDGQERHLWIDAETFLDTKIDGTRIVGDTVWPVETYFSDYRKVSGLQIPHVLDTSIGGARTTERIIIEHVAINPVLSDAIFAAPATGR